MEDEGKIDDSAEKEISALKKLYTIKKIQMEMVSLRGYILPPEEEEISRGYGTDDGLALFRKLYSSKKEDPEITSFRCKMAKLYNPHSGDLPPLYVYYIDDLVDEKAKDHSKRKNVGKKSIENFTNSIKNVFPSPGNGNIIAVHNTGFTSTAKDMLAETSKNYNISVFGDGDLMFNPTKHFTAQRHELLTKEEMQSLLKVCPLGSLPSILEEDRIIKFLGFEKGSVVRIYRKQIFPTSVPIAETLVYKVVR